jgi:tetratricopeptide (TPR) repeat protein
VKKRKLFFFIANSLKGKPRQKSILVLASIAILIVVGVVVLVFGLRSVNHTPNDTNPASKSSVVAAWSKGDIDTTLQLCRISLKKEPLDPFYLSFGGIAAFYSALGKPESEERQNLLVESIVDLRKSLVCGKPLPIKAQVEYVLGKAYYYEGQPWYDLAASFLASSQKDGYTAKDINEYLGIVYAGLGDNLKAVHYFEISLGKSASDLLLLTAAMSYKELGNTDREEALLHQIESLGKDAVVLQKARFMLGDIAIGKNDYVSAGKIFQSILDSDPGSADAWYRIGIVYSKSNDPIRARAAWRKALSLDPNNIEARKKLAEKF